MCHECVNSICLRIVSEACEPHHLYYPVIIFRPWDLIFFHLPVEWVGGVVAFLQGNSGLYMKLTCGHYLVLKLRMHEAVSSWLFSHT